MNKYLETVITVAISVVLSVGIMGVIHRHNHKAKHGHMVAQKAAQMHRPMKQMRPMQGQPPHGRPQGNGPQHHP